jgi:soluble P-type ATPase
VGGIRRPGKGRQIAHPTEEEFIMIEIVIPGERVLRVSHVVLDFNGTIAMDGELLSGVRERLIELARLVTVHVITADTFGSARAELAGLPCIVNVLPQIGQAHAKLAYVGELGRGTTACIGNGRNDRLMLQAAVLGIAVIGPEGAAAEALAAADTVVAGPLAALDLLLKPQRLVATLRS